MGLFTRKPKPEPMPATIEDAMAEQASDFVDAFRGDGSPVPNGALDYSRTSLQAVDNVLDDFYTQGVPLPDELHFIASSYVFEVARREFGGRYLRAADPDPFVLVIGEPEFQVGVMVMGKVAGRAANGPEDSIPFFYEGIAPLVDRKQSATLV
ncbi:hypothetical protein [Plantibacter sp. YIM 135347]|uniref:hypothetical protein n=1 Tax=Plantibacter sp. YIM 135347 TaxID=3423919 RepID=UPI003D34C7F4